MKNQKEYEEYVVSILLNNGKILSENYIRLKEDLFEEVEHKFIFNKILKAYERFHSLLDEEILTTLITEEGGLNEVKEHYLTLLVYLQQKEVEVEKFLFYFEELKKFSKTSKIIKVLNTTVDYFQKEQFDAGEESLLKGVLDSLSDSHFSIDRGEVIEDVPERKKLLTTKNECTSGVLTGLEKLDDLTRGLWPGELGLIMGRTSIGKSMLALHFAKGAFFEKRKVLYITEEMPKLQIALRFDAAISHIAYKKFKFGTVTPGEITRWETRMDDMKKIYDQGGRFYIHHIPLDCSLEAIQGEIEFIQKIKKEKIDVVIVDDIDMMIYPKGMTDEQGHATNAQGLKGLATHYSIPLWFTTQLATSAYEKETTNVGDVGYSRRKIMVSDFAVSLVQTKEDKDVGSISLELVKYRDGFVGKLMILRPDLSKAIIHLEENEFQRNGNVLTEAV